MANDGAGNVSACKTIAQPCQLCDTTPTLCFPHSPSTDHDVCSVVWLVKQQWDACVDGGLAVVVVIGVRGSLVAAAAGDELPQSKCCSLRFQDLVPS